jgi:hypothetical protein
MPVQKFEIIVGLRFCCSGKMCSVRVVGVLAGLGQLVVFGFVLFNGWARKRRRNGGLDEEKANG